MGLNMDHRLVDSIMGKIRNLPQVEWACTTTGRFDAFMFARFRSNEEFSVFLRDNITVIDGLKDSETFMCLHVEKEGQIRWYFPAAVFSSNENLQTYSIARNDTQS